MTITVDLVKEPAGDTYRRLVTWCASRSARVLVVLRSNVRLTALGESFLQTLGPYRVSVAESREWPGTKLLEGTATILTYDNTPAVLEALLTSSDHLYGWVHPSLPEDLSFLRLDGSPLLTTVAHERDGYLDLTTDEYRALGQYVPDLQCVVRGRDTGASS